LARNNAIIDARHVYGTRTFRATLDFVSNQIAFAWPPASGAERRDVQKNPLAATILLDEAVTLLVVPSLDFALKAHVFRMDGAL